MRPYPGLAGKLSAPSALPTLSLVVPPGVMPARVARSSEDWLLLLGSQQFRSFPHLPEKSIDFACDAPIPSSLRPHWRPLTCAQIRSLHLAFFADPWPTRAGCYHPQILVDHRHLRRKVLLVRILVQIAKHALRLALALGLIPKLRRLFCVFLLRQSIQVGHLFWLHHWIAALL